MALVKSSLILLLLNIRSSQATITQEKYISDERLRAAIDGNNGAPVAAGYHAHLVVFLKKPNVTDSEELENVRNPRDFSTDGPFLCSGTILNRRYALTKATPIAYYPVGSYWMSSQREIATDVDLELMNLIELDFVMIHPEHEPGHAHTDLAVVRTSQPLSFGFETRNVNSRFGDTPTALRNCKLVLWAWFFDREAERKVNVMSKSEIAFEIKDEYCTGKEEHAPWFICSAHAQVTYQPCAINSGSPVLCNSVLVGIYGGTSCDESPALGYDVLRVDYGATKTWLSEVMSEPTVWATSPELNYFEDSQGRHVTLAMCPSEE